MRFTNTTGAPAAWTMGFERDGREMLIIVVKATYDLPRDGEEAALHKEQVPLIEADQFSGEPGLSAPAFETDFAHRKPACDVLLVGSAHAPEGRPATKVHVGLQLGLMSKRFCVVGRRTWYKGVLGLAATPAEPFQSMPISYDTAFGGTDRTEEAEGKVDTFLPNPVGKGWWRHASRADGQPLPNTEEIDRAVSDPGGSYVPMAFTPIGRNWPPRPGYAGTYDQQWMENDAPFWPADFDHRYFQAAPPDQIIPYPSGGEQVHMLNLTPDGSRSFRLPVRTMPVTFIPHKGRDVTLQAKLDTIVLEPDHERFSMTWRANLPLGRSVFDVKETIAGEMSPAWHRARRVPNKTYYRNLAEMAAAERNRRKPS